jgi:Family of unknown function (DUF6356)
MRAMLDRYFLAHPRSVNESYLQHAGVALRISMLLFGAALAAFVHALVPCLFKTTASSTIKTLHGQVASRSGLV